MADTNEVAFLWQHEENSKWISYSTDTLEKVNNAFNKGQKSLTLPEKKVLYLSTMFQKNKTSGLKQKIRCCVFDNGWFVWQHKSHYEDVWDCYTPSISLELEACFKQGKNAAEFLSKRTYYTVDLKKFRETIEDSEYYERKVCRQEVPVHLTPYLKDLGTIFKTYLEAKCQLDAAVAEKLNCPRPKRMKLESTDENVLVSVDKQCIGDMQKRTHVYYDESSVYDAMLNQTDLQYNVNKFYRIQLLKEHSRHRYYVWHRCGRVGTEGKGRLRIFHGELESAKEDFRNRFFEKTENEWEHRKNFKKVAGKYDLLKMQTSGIEEACKISEVVVETELCDLPGPLIILLRKISDSEAFMIQAKEMKYDVKKNPLGNLDSEQIKAGWSALKNIECLIKNGESSSVLEEACSEYYTRVPHNYGMKMPPLISDDSALLREMQLLQVLTDAAVSFNELQLSVGNRIADLYKTLECELKPVLTQSGIYAMIETYLHNTHGPTHNYKMKIIHVYECNKPVEREAFQDYGNKYLLWHGSRITNFLGILKYGLQIAPPEVPSSGYMFGKGIYFADMSSKSANYCRNKKTNEGLLLLCEVSLGHTNVLYSENYDADKMMRQEKMHSVSARGMFIPNPIETIEWEEMKIPLGEPIKEEDTDTYKLNYNEYIVYNRRQVKLRYIVHVRFN